MSLRGLRSILHTTFSLFTDFNHLLNSKLHLIVTHFTHIPLNLETLVRQYVGKDAEPTSPRVRVSLPAAHGGQNVDTLRVCKRSSRDFFRLSTGNTYILSSPVFSYITRGVLRCLLGFFGPLGPKTLRGQ